MNYFDLKKQKAAEQGKQWWFEATLTDKEANLRQTSKNESSCFYCRYYNYQSRCLRDHSIESPQLQICDEWRYFA